MMCVRHCAPDAPRPPIASVTTKPKPEALNLAIRERSQRALGPSGRESPATYSPAPERFAKIELQRRR